MTPTISASAIESFDHALGGCARKWAFSRLDNLPKPQSPGAALGSRCHELWESYLRDGVPFDLSTVEGRICQATQHQLPKPGTCFDIEASFKFDWESVSWAGKIDAVFGDYVDTVVVLDHKTTSDFRYAKSERASLLGHPQAPLYAIEECREHEKHAVTLAWNYVKHGVTFDKNIPTAHGYAIKSARRPVALEPPVRLVVSRAEAEDSLGRFVPTAKRMLKIIQEPPSPGEDGLIARQLEPNPDACEAFGGCPYRAQCGLTPQEIASKLRSFATAENGEQGMGSALRDRIAAIKADRAGNGPTHTSAIGVQQAIEAEAAAKMQQAIVATAQEFVGNAGTVKAEPPSLLPQTSPFPQVAQATAYEARSVDAEALRQAKPGNEGRVVYGPVNPPEGVDVEARAKAANAEGAGTVLTANAYGPGPDGRTALLAVTLEPLPPAEAPTRPDSPQSLPPKRRGRPPGSRNKVKSELPPAETQSICPSDGPVPNLKSPRPDYASEDFDIQAGGSTLPDGTRLDTIPAPSQELLSDDVMAEIARRVTSRIARALLATINENEEP